MLPHLADKFRHGIPVLFATSVVELLEVMRSFDCVGLKRGTGNTSVRESWNLRGRIGTRRFGPCSAREKLPYHDVARFTKLKHALRVIVATRHRHASRAFLVVEYSSTVETRT